tara:strand:- start:185 stop:355 length:171 start_codon:yes stop_codon:yes gene_type:complete
MATVREEEKEDQDMKIKRARTLWFLGLFSISLISAAFLYSKPASADPSITVYKTPT